MITEREFSKGNSYIIKLRSKDILEEIAEEKEIENAIKKDEMNSLYNQYINSQGCYGLIQTTLPRESYWNEVKENGGVD